MGYLRRLLPIVVPSVILGVALIWRVSDPGRLLVAFRHQVFDEYQRILPRTFRPAPVLIVNIDDASLSKIGQWPWPRTEIADLVARLHNAGAASIAFDMVFAEPDRMAPSSVLAVWSKTAHLGRLKAELSALPDPDQIFSRIVRESGNVVTGFAMLDKANGKLPIAHGGIAFAGDNPRRFLYSYRGAVPNLPEIAKAAAGNGSFTFTPDRDLVIRRLPLFEVLNGKIYPSLIAEALRVAEGASTDIVKSSGANGALSFGAHTGVVAVKIGDNVIPTDRRGDIQIYYTPHEPARFLPAWKILASDFHPSKVKGKIVLIGATAAGLLDLRPTPVDPVMPGVEVQAQALEQILLDNYLYRPDWAPAADWLFTLALGLLLIFLLRAVGALWSAVVGGLAVSGAFAISWYLFSSHHLLIDPVLASSTALAVYLSGSLMGYLRSERERRTVRGAFSQYLSPTMVAELVANPRMLKLGGEMKEMTLLFCDIRDFTRISERFRSDPRRLTHLINRFLTPMTDVILAHNGTIDKYMGDCIMAFWNAPLDDADHARHATHAALAMMGELKKLNAEIKEEAVARSQPNLRLDIGIGINTGRCVVGNMGSEQRFDYSVLGDAVNLASRLEGLSKTYGVPIVISETTRAEAPNAATIELDLVAVKGKTEATRIYALLGSKAEADLAWLGEIESRHNAMLEAYRLQNWDLAEELLCECRDRAPKLKRLYALYSERLALFRADPPGPEWAGIHIADSK